MQAYPRRRTCGRLRERGELTMETEKWERIPVEALKKGDCIKVFGTVRRVVAIKPYIGPYDFVFAVAVYQPGPTTEITLCKGEFFEVMKGEN